MGGRGGVLPGEDLAGRGIVVIAMSPILADGLRPVGGAWPVAHKRRFGPEGKGEVRSGSVSLAAAGCPDADGEAGQED